MDRAALADELSRKAPRYRVEIIEMLTEAGSGHPGGSLSAIDLISTLYHYKLRQKPTEPLWAERDRFVLSKGHGVPAQYAVMADLGYFPREQLWTLRKLNSRLQGHPHIRGASTVVLAGEYVEVHPFKLPRQRVDIRMLTQAAR